MVKEISDDFSKQKILYPDIMRMPKEMGRLSDYPRFYLDCKGFYPEATLFLITGEDLDVLLRFLCSKVGFFIFTKFFAGPQFDATGFRFKKEYLITLPVPHSDSKYEENNYTKWLINKIGLTRDEVEYTEQYINDLMALRSSK